MLNLYSTAAAAAKSLRSCPTLCDPRDGSPPGSPVPGILQARTLEWVAISLSNAWKWKVKVKSLSCVRGMVNFQSLGHPLLPSVFPLLKSMRPFGSTEKRMLPFLPMLLTSGLWCWKSPMILELLLGMVTLAEGGYKQPAGPSLTFGFPISGTSFKINHSSEDSACLQLLMTHWKERELHFERLGNLSSMCLLSSALNHETWLQTADLNLEVQPSWVDFRVPPWLAPLSLSALLQENSHDTQWGDRISGDSKGVRKGGVWGWGFLRFLLPSPCLPRSSPWGFRPPTFSFEVPLGVPGSHGPAGCSEVSPHRPLPLPHIGNLASFTTPHHL